MGCNLKNEEKEKERREREKEEKEKAKEKEKGNQEIQIALELKTNFQQSIIISAAKRQAIRIVLRLLQSSKHKGRAATHQTSEPVHI